MNRVRSGFVLKMVKSYLLCMGVANVHAKKNQGLAFHRTGDRPEALLCPIVMKSVTNKPPSMWDFFFSRIAHQYPKFPWNSIKKKIKSKKEACGRELIPCQALRRPSVCDPFGQVNCIPWSFSSVTGQLGRAKCGRPRLRRRERMGVCT